MRFQTTLYFLVFLFGFLLVACANTDSKTEIGQSSKPNAGSHHPTNDSVTNSITQGQADNFTTFGKPTKWRETPIARVEIYDISQDEEVVRAIKDVYEQGHLTFGDVTHRYSDIDSKNFFSPDVDVTPAALLLMKARQIAYYDLFRTSCQKVERAPCGLGNSSFRTEYRTYNLTCKNCNLGKTPDFNTEELRGNYARVSSIPVSEDRVRKGRWPVSFKGPGDSVPINECGDISKQPLLPYYYIGEKSGYSLEETQTLLLHHVCDDE